MSLIASLIFIAQVGPFTSPSSGNASPLPPELQNRKPRREAPAALPPAKPEASSGTSDCLKDAAADPAGAVDRARAWRDGSKDVERAGADLCLGTALSALGRWTEAEGAFLDGRQASEGAPALQARLGAMAGNAALASGAYQRALGQLDEARTEVDRGDPQLFGIEMDRARALVGLARLAEAETALTEARALAPANADAWLLSATLARRMDKLAEAQTRIEKAAQLSPIDPDIGLEAGVIAMFSGREEAARKSWQSVIAAAPQSPAAQTARGYLAQISATAPASAPAPATVKEPAGR